MFIKCRKYGPRKSFGLVMRAAKQVRVEALEPRRLLSSTLFTVNPSMSQISVSGTAGVGENIVPQSGTNILGLPDSLTTELSGNITADVESNSITFQLATSMPALNNGSWEPDSSLNPSNSEAANLGGMVVDYNEQIAERGLVLQFTSSQITLNPNGTFDPSQLLVTSTTGTIYYAGLFAGTYPLAGGVGNNQATTGATLSSSGGVQTLSIPIYAQYTDSINAGGTVIPVNLTYQGTVVATTGTPAPSQLAFVSQPVTGTAGVTLPQISVAIEDQSGNKIAGNDSNVTLSIASGSGTLVGTVAVAAQNGVADFSSSYISSPGSVVLAASDTADSLSGFDSATITVGNPAGLSPSAGASYAITGPVGTQMVDVGTGTINLTGDLSNSFSNYTLKIENGALVTLGNDQHMGGLTLVGNGSLDVKNYTMLINYGANPDPVAAVSAALKSGLKGGAWNGAGIFSSVAAVNTRYALGYADGTDGIVSGLSSGQIEIKYTLYGDLNLDGVVNGTDFGYLAAHFGKAITGWDHGDLNYDGAVNGTDFGLLAANFGKTATGAAAELLSPNTASTALADNATSLLSANTTATHHQMSNATALLATRPALSVPKEKRQQSSSN
jgi:hypothetical protein